MIWFRFEDTWSGGTQKTAWEEIFVEAADEAAAVRIFEERTGAVAHGESCDCCTPDFAIEPVDAPPPGAHLDIAILVLPDLGVWTAEDLAEVEKRAKELDALFGDPIARARFEVPK